MVRNSSHLSVFVPQHLREALELSARVHDRSLSAELRCAIRSYISPAGPLSLSYPHPEGTRDEPGRPGPAGPTAPKRS